jgi:hypothetical protein
MYFFFLLKIIVFIYITIYRIVSLLSVIERVVIGFFHTIFLTCNKIIMKNFARSTGICASKLAIIIIIFFFKKKNRAKNWVGIKHEWMIQSHLA